MNPNWIPYLISGALLIICIVILWLWYITERRRRKALLYNR